MEREREREREGEGEFTILGGNIGEEEEKEGKLELI